LIPGMKYLEAFRARGHPNVRARHETTVMVTRDKELTTRGDCIVAVAAEKGLRDLDPDLKRAARSMGSKIALAIEAGGREFKVTGRGDPRLTLTDPRDMVARKSGYICGRTLMVEADKAACDMDEALLDLLRDGEEVVNITVTVESVTQMEGVSPS